MRNDGENAHIFCLRFCSHSSSSTHYRYYPQPSPESCKMSLYRTIEHQMITEKHSLPQMSDPVAPQAMNMRSILDNPNQNSVGVPNPGEGISTCVSSDNPAGSDVRVIPGATSRREHFTIARSDESTFHASDRCSAAAPLTANAANCSRCYVSGCK